MNDQDYIRKGASLSDDDFCLYEDSNGAIFFHGTPSYPINPDNAPQWFLDALAAQLVRQVDAIFAHACQCEKGFTAVRTYKAKRDGVTPIWQDVMASYGPNRTMNTIKAIVDSAVLEGRDE